VDPLAIETQEQAEFGGIALGSSAGLGGERSGLQPLIRTPAAMGGAATLAGDHVVVEGSVRPAWIVSGPGDRDRDGIDEWEVAGNLWYVPMGAVGKRTGVHASVAGSWMANATTGVRIGRRRLRPRTRGSATGDRAGALLGVTA
jgi:hypothetical protein